MLGPAFLTCEVLREISVRSAGQTSCLSDTRTCHPEKRLIDFNVYTALKTQPGMIIKSSQ